MILKTSTKINTSSQTRDQTNIKAPTKQEKKHNTKKTSQTRKDNNIKQPNKGLYRHQNTRQRTKQEQNTKKNHIKQPNKELNKKNKHPENKTKTTS